MKLLLRLAAALAGMMPLYGAVSCTVSTSGVAFGSYNPFGSAANDSSGTVTVTCSALLGETASYQVSVAVGTGTYASRKFSSSGSLAGYNLYIDSGRSQVWGNGTGGTFVISDSYQFLQVGSIVKNYTVYGRMPGSQNQAPAGNYIENLTVSVTF